MISKFPSKSKVLWIQEMGKKQYLRSGRPSTIFKLLFNQFWEFEKLTSHNVYIYNSLFQTWDRMYFPWLFIYPQILNAGSLLINPLNTRPSGRHEKERNPVSSLQALSLSLLRQIIDRNGTAKYHQEGHWFTNELRQNSLWKQNFLVELACEQDLEGWLGYSSTEWGGNEEGGDSQVKEAGTRNTPFDFS